MAYATVNELLDRMGHPTATNAAMLARLESALDAATTAIDRDTGRTFSPIIATKLFAADDPTVLPVPDLVSVTTLTVDDDDDGVFETTIAASGYELDTFSTVDGWPYEMISLLDRSWPSAGRRRRRIQIAGSWGWSAVPAPINQACTLLASRVAKRSSAAVFGVESFGDAGAAMIRTNDPDYRHLIGPYQRPLVA